MDSTFDIGQTPARFAFRDDPPRPSKAPIFDVLDADHAKILRLFEAVAWYAEGAEERLDLFRQLRWELLAHLRAEEEVTYPSLVTADAAFVARSLDEHRGFDAAIERLEHTPVGQDWIHQLTALRAGLLTHMKAEQEFLFSNAKQELPLDAQNVLARAFEAARNAHLRALGARC